MPRSTGWAGRPRSVPVTTTRRWTASSLDRLVAIERLGEISDALAALPRREQDVLALVALADLSYEEVAVALGLPIGTVRSRLARARARLTGPSSRGPGPAVARPTTPIPKEGDR
ncbi:MAG: sigma-70 family RNA polymerase sigma factor [Solirubrobacteraceae bacterium]|nr:sigma-70 family RNA polymerase sigma factor [Solirubrobacteraceae bacterium]